MQSFVAILATPSAHNLYSHTALTNWPPPPVPVCPLKSSVRVEFCSRSVWYPGLELQLRICNEHSIWFDKKILHTKLGLLSGCCVEFFFAHKNLTVTKFVLTKFSLLTYPFYYFSKSYFNPNGDIVFYPDTVRVMGSCSHSLNSFPWLAV